MSRIVERARERKNEIDERTAKIERIKQAIEELGSSPTLAKFRSFLNVLKEIIEETRGN